MVSNQNLGSTNSEVNYRNSPYIPSAKDWVGGSIKWPVLMMLCTDMVGVSKKVQNYADVIHEWSLSKKNWLKKVGIAQFNDIG